MAKAKISNGAYTVISGIKSEDLKKLAKYAPSALVLKDENKNEIFKYTFDAKETGSISKYGMIFSETTADGYACFTALFDKPYEEAKRKAIVKDLLTPVQVNSTALEAQIKAELDKLSGILSNIDNNIEVAD